MNRYYRKAESGFTVLELLVATTISVLMLALINQLFSSTTNAVGEGARMGQILAANQAISAQIRRDAEAMVGPSEGGFLLIINKEIDGVTVLHPDPHVGTEQRAIRSDQLVFFRRAENLESLTPGTDDSFSNRAPAPYARLWYGHVLRTDPGGTGPFDEGLGVGPNTIGTNWILGRQALLLAGSMAGNIYVGDFINSDFALHDSIINNTNNPILNDPLYMGYTDVSSLNLTDLTGPVTSVPGVTAVFEGLPEPTYKNAAYRYAFPDTLTVLTTEKRLRVNPDPDFTSRQIAQMHPYWMDNVSDFVVEFAMDTEPEVAPDEPDTHGGTGNLVWYGVTNPLPFNLNSNHPTLGQRYAYTAKHFPASALPPGEQRFTFRHDYADYWPYLIRIRYRLHDRLGRFQEHTGDTNNGQRESGKWFEQIIAVNRK